MQGASVLKQGIFIKWASANAFQYWLELIISWQSQFKTFVTFVTQQVTSNNITHKATLAFVFEWKLLVYIVNSNIKKCSNRHRDDDVCMTAPLSPYRSRFIFCRKHFCRGFQFFAGWTASICICLSPTLLSLKKGKFFSEQFEFRQV